PTIRLPCSGTPTGRSRPGMTSASPAVSSTERDFAGRQAPWSNEAEQAVLGAMLLDQDAALKAAEVLDDTMFYRESHRLLFRAMIALTERGDVIDPVTLRDELMRRGDLDRAGGMEYLGGLIDVVPTAANVDYHAKIVRDKAVLRRLIEAATAIIQDAYDGRLTSGDMLDNAEHRVFQVAQLKRAEEFVRLKELIWPTMEGSSNSTRARGRSQAWLAASPTWTGSPPGSSEGISSSWPRAHRWERRRWRSTSSSTRQSSTMSRWPSSRWKCPRSSSSSGCCARRGSSTRSG